MGRKLKRVALDFDWPLSKVWGGYVNPFYRQRVDCPDCTGDGSSPEARRLKDQWYGNAPFRPEDRGSVPFPPTHPTILGLARRNVDSATCLTGGDSNAVMREARRLADHFNGSWSHHLSANDVAALVQSGRLLDFTHTWTRDDGWQPKVPPYTPTPEEVNGWGLSGMGHDSINQWVCVKAECERLGYPSRCVRCDGEGSLWPSPAVRQQAEDWQQTKPPAGDGYQIWETVSEGSPISPVFADPAELARWMAAHPWNKCDANTTEDQWLKFILGPGWAPSFISQGGAVGEWR